MILFSSVINTCNKIKINKPFDKSLVFKFNISEPLQKNQYYKMNYLLIPSCDLEIKDSIVISKNE